MGQLTTIQLISVLILPVLFAVTVHEVAHGYVAYLLGDKTARVLGRLTLNPLKHIDIFGTIIVPAVLIAIGGIVFGWAKPVPINTRNLHHLKRDLALIAVAGPAANFLMAIFWAGIMKIAMLILPYDMPGTVAILYMGKAGIQINLWLMALNLIPIPPLDGGHILLGVLPRKIARYYDRISPFGFYILLILLIIGVLSTIINPVVNLLYQLVRLIFKI